MVQEVTLLGLINVLAAFNCVDHAILLHRLEVLFGLKDIAGRVDWILSLLGPLLYVLYTTELNQIVASHVLHLHICQ